MKLTRTLQAIFCGKMAPCLKIDELGRLSKRAKIYAVLLTTILIVLLIFVYNIPSILGASSREYSKNFEQIRNSNLELKLVHVIFRHGQRTPADTYPNDPYKTETFHPYGWGQLTNLGRRQLYDLGVFLKDRYNTFLSNPFSFDEVYSQSTGVTRTKMSLQLVLAGLFPPIGTILEWNTNLNWLPIPYNYEELDNDKLLLVRKSCPRYYEELTRVFSEDLKDVMDDNAAMFEDLTNITGLNITTPDDIQSLFSTLKAESDFGFKLPQWTENYYPSKLNPLTVKSYMFNSYNTELKRLKGGVFLKKAIQDWENNKLQKSPIKLFLYAGHDSTITNILSAFNVWDLQFPDYAITTIIELSKHKITNQYGVEIFLRNSTTSPPIQLTIPGCSKFCPLEDVEILLNPNIPTNWTAECKSLSTNFTVPTIKGP